MSKASTPPETLTKEDIEQLNYVPPAMTSLIGMEVGGIIGLQSSDLFFAVFSVTDTGKPGTSALLEYKFSIYTLYGNILSIFLYFVALSACGNATMRL